ncbi:MAG: Crp/Fnr family transcriptional regulator, partial [Bdellovibrionales bacterium]
FFIIEQGSVEIVTSLGGKEKILALIKPGESFGEFALLDHSVRSASARAAEDSVVVRVSEEGYEHLLSELPTWASYMLRSFASRLKNMNRVLKGLS